MKIVEIDCRRGGETVGLELSDERVMRDEEVASCEEQGSRDRPA